MKTSRKINKQIMIKGENQSPQPEVGKGGGGWEREGLAFQSDSEMCRGAGWIRAFVWVGEGGPEKRLTRSRPPWDSRYSPMPGGSPCPPEERSWRLYLKSPHLARENSFKIKTV